MEQVFFQRYHKEDTIVSSDKYTGWWSVFVFEIATEENATSIFSG
jgi:hypothetical protein